MLALTVAFVAIGSLTSAAVAADSVYWTNKGAPGAIRVGSLNGGTASNVITGETGASGIAIDPAGGRLFWGNQDTNAIRVGSLGGGTGSDLFTGESYASGVAVDPAAGKLYWVDNLANTVRVGGVGGGSGSTLFGSEAGPAGVAINPAAGKIYWTNYNGGQVRVGNLDGSGSATSLFTGEGAPGGVAIDQAAGKIYWSDRVGGLIRVGNLNGTGTPITLFMGENYPSGVAIDPAAGKIYWTTFTGGAIRVANLNGGGTPSDLFTGEIAPSYLALLRSPVGSGAPQVSGGATVGSTLSCSQGSWAADLLGALLYRAPQSFTYQWQLNGTDIPGATSSSYAAFVAGSYTCRVTGINQAGSATQTSAAHVVTGAAQPPNTKIRKAKINQPKHKATFRFKAIGTATGFQCKLKRAHHKKPKAKFRGCSSPKTYKHLKPGKYKFKVRAKGPGGTDPTPAHKRFRIKS